MSAGWRHLKCEHLPRTRRDRPRSRQTRIHVAPIAEGVQDLGWAAVAVGKVGEAWLGLTELLARLLVHLSVLHGRGTVIRRRALGASVARGLSVSGAFAGCPARTRVLVARKAAVAIFICRVCVCRVCSRRQHSRHTNGIHAPQATSVTDSPQQHSSGSADILCPSAQPVRARRPRLHRIQSAAHTTEGGRPQECHGA